MPPVVGPTMSVLIGIVADLPIGTNLSMLHFLWMLVNGSLLTHRGALFPALQSTGIGPQAVRRAWAAFMISSSVKCPVGSVRRVGLLST